MKLSCDVAQRKLIPNIQQEAMLSCHRERERDCVMHRVTKQFAKSHKVTQDHSNDTIE